MTASARSHLWFLTAPMGVLLGGTSVQAQQIGDFLGSDIPYELKRSYGTSVAERPHTDLEPIGARVGSMIVFPKVELGTGFSSNVFGLTTNALADGYVTLAPRVTAASQWSRNSLELTGAVGLIRFFSQSVRSQTAYSLQANGRLDLGKSDSIIGIIGRPRAFETQYVGSFPQNAAGTVGYNRTNALVRGTFHFNRVSLVGSGTINDLVYSDTPSFSGPLINQQFRNRTEYRTSARLQYDFNTDVQAFTEVSYSRHQYHTAILGQPLRTNNGFRALAGANLDITPVIRAVVGVGYEQRVYVNPAYQPLRGLALDARVEWLPTELTTVNLRVTRKVEDAILENSPGFFSTIGQVRVDHELLRYVLVFAEATYARDSFVTIPRRDAQFTLRAGGTYSLGRRFSIQPNVSYVQRRSKGLQQGQTFSEFRGGLNFTVQL